VLPLGVLQTGEVMNIRRSLFRHAFLAAIVGACLALTACISSEGAYAYRESLFGGLLGERAHHSRRGWVLSEQASIAVAPFQNAYLTDAQLLVLQAELARELDKSFAQVSMISERTSVHEWLAAAKGRQNHYLIAPALTEELDALNGLPELLDNPSYANIGPDSVSIKIALYNVPTATLIDLALVEVKGPWLGLENRRATDLSGSAFAVYVRRLNATPHL